MSATRADRLERLRGLQKRMREIEEVRLADLVRRAEGLAEEARAILQSLGDQSLLHGLFLDAKAERLRRKEAERTAVLAQIETARERVSEAGRAHKRLERVAEEARGRQDLDDEARALAELLDAHLSRAGGGA